MAEQILSGNIKVLKISRQSRLRFCACGCGEEIHVLRSMSGYLRRFKRYHHIKFFDSKGEKHCRWNGGIKMYKNYRYTRKPDHHFATIDGYVAEHRLAYEEHYKCSLMPWVDIHHMDENKLNNNWWNLKPLSRGKHRSYHRKNMNNRFCSNSLCKTPYKTRIDKQTNRPRWFSDGSGGYLCNRCDDKKRRQKKHP